MWGIYIWIMPKDYIIETLRKHYHIWKMPKKFSKESELNIADF